MDVFLNPRQYFQQLGMKPRKRFGQHFLTQPTTAKRIVEHADLEYSDVVVEVGPGLGALTQFILPKVHLVHLVELDWDLAAYLVKATQSIRGRVFVHQLDVLDFDLESLSQVEQQRLVILGNLPYNITSPLIFRLLDSMPTIKRAVFMVQREVGERLAARPGTKNYGVLSVLLGVCAIVTKLFHVGPEQFQPKPEVDSIVIRIDFQERLPEAISSFRFFKTIVNLAFQQRRKTLKNSLKSLLSIDINSLEQTFIIAGIDPTRRPETLTPEEFLRLAAAFETARVSASRK